MNLAKKVALVTGAGGAIGSNLIDKLSRENVTCIAIDKDLGLKCDFANPEKVIELSDKIKKTYPIIDFIYNVAGIGIYEKLESLTFEKWRDTFSINVDAPFILSKNLLPNLKKSSAPMIFNIGSGMGVFGASERSSYCSSKFALRGSSLSLNKELKNENIDVCLLTLGSVMTPFGTGGIDKGKELARSGKKYLTVDEVTDKIIAITKSERREEEYVFYPEGYI